MRRFFQMVIFGVYIAFISTAPTASGSTRHSDYLQKSIPHKDTLEITYERYAPVLKAKIEKHLRQARIFGNLAIAMLPATFFTFGLSYFAGLVFALIAAVNVARIRTLQSDFPELENDPRIMASIQSSYVRIGIMTLVILGLPVFLFVLISAFIFFEAAITTFVFLTAFLALLSFILLDWLVFRSGKY